jgi:hypothetical protein
VRENWSKLTPEEKREERLKKWISPPNVQFKSAEAEKTYKERANRILNARLVKEPDRVPVILPTGNFPVYYSGWTLKKVMYDYQALQQSWTKFMEDFYNDMDALMGPNLVYSGTMLEFLQYKPYKWPGHGLGDDVNTYQFVEEAYMSSDEYDDLLQDPSDFTFRVLVPRAIRSMDAIKKLPPLCAFMDRPLNLAFSFARPEIRAAFKALMDAGEEIEKWEKYVKAFNNDAISAGFPAARGGLAVAPFDMVGDTLRGTKGVVMDMYRRPEKLLETIDMITEHTIERVIAMVDATDGFTVSFPLHKGDDTFMSDEHFEKFYWPSLKRVIDALIQEGIMVSLFAEGRYNRRLEPIKDFPRGWVMWMFDQTDMANAKKIVGDTCCIAGNVPSSIMNTGTAKEVKSYCRKLIETCAPGGGYILTGGASATESRPENFRAFMKAAQEFGVYN